MDTAAQAKLLPQVELMFWVPGNVGGVDALAQVVKTWSRPARLSTKDILLVSLVSKYSR